MTLGVHAGHDAAVQLVPPDVKLDVAARTRHTKELQAAAPALADEEAVHAPDSGRRRHAYVRVPGIQLLHNFLQGERAAIAGGG